MVRAFALGVAVGVTGLLFGILEAVRRASSAGRVRHPIWPRHDGSDQGFGSVWDHGA